MERQAQFRVLFESMFRGVKAEFGVGQFSYTEGMNRKSARLIARNRSRAEFRKERGIDQQVGA